MSVHTLHLIIVFCLVVAVFTAFLREWLSPDLVALSAMGVLLVSGVLTADETLNVFSNSAPVVISCLFVLSAGLERTGVIDSLARIFTRMAGTTERRAACFGCVDVTTLGADQSHAGGSCVCANGFGPRAQHESKSIASAYSLFLFHDLRRHDHTYRHLYESARRWNCASPGSRTIWDI